MKLMIFSFLAIASLAQAKEVEVQMKSISYAPKLTEVSVGDSVVWKNISYTEHSATGDNFDTGLVKPKNQSKRVVFSTAGTYPYHCKIHGKTMSGTIQVDAK
jgi:plastocyanin